MHAFLAAWTYFNPSRKNFSVSQNTTAKVQIRGLYDLRVVITVLMRIYYLLAILLGIQVC